MPMHRGKRLAVHPGDGAAFDDVHLQMGVQPGEMTNHALVLVPVPTSDFAPHVFGERDRLETRQRRNNCVETVRKVVLAMGSVICPATWTTPVDLGVHCNESQLPRREAVAGRTIYTHRTRCRPIRWRD